MNFLWWRRLPLTVKLTIIITSIVVLVVIFVSALSARRERQSYQTEMELQAALLLDTLEASVADELYILDADFLAELMLNLGQFEVVSFGRIYDSEGRVIADALDPNSRFGLSPDPLGQQLVQSNSIVYVWQEEQLVAGQPVFVGSQTIGAISVGLPTAVLSRKITQVRNQGVAAAIIAVIVGGALAVLFSRSITGPLQEMVDVTELIREGDLSQRVKIDSGDEIATLGGHFNQMAAALERTLHLMEQEIEGHKQTEAELQIAKESAEAANRSKSTFLANMSHELRTPLSAILGYSELMLEQLQDGDYQDFDVQLKRILLSGKHLLNIIGDILDMSKIEAGKMELQLDEFELPDLVRAVTQIARPLAQKNGNRFIVSPTDGLGFMVADEGRLHQVLLNILANAVKFTEDGTITFQVEQEADWVHFVVSDTGIGIAPDNLPLLFKPFVQVDSSTTRKYEGTGLGLAISYHFCRMMGGNITVESELGKGSKFTAHLPRYVTEIKRE